MADKLAMQSQWGDLADKVKNPYITRSTGGADNYFVANDSDSSTSIGFGIGSGGINHGAESYTQNRWMIKSDGTNTYLADDARVLGGWYRVGSSSVQDQTSLKMTLPASDPAGIRVLVAIECNSGTASWCDVRALGSSDNVINYTRLFSKTNSGGTVSKVQDTGSPFMSLPLGALNQSAFGVAESLMIQQNSPRRIWVWHSGGANQESFDGGSRANTTTEIKAIQVVTSGSCNINLEVWCRN